MITTLALGAMSADWYYRFMNVNTLRPKQNGHHFADDTFKRIFLHENVRILIKMSLKCVPKCSINDIPALVQIMAWRRPGDKPLSEPMMARLLTHIYVTRPQWVSMLCTYILKCITISWKLVLLKDTWDSISRVTSYLSLRWTDVMNHHYQICILTLCPLLHIHCVQSQAHLYPSMDNLRAWPVWENYIWAVIISCLCWSRPIRTSSQDQLRWLLGQWGYNCQLLFGDCKSPS